MQHLEDWQTQHPTRPHVSAESLKTVRLSFDQKDFDSYFYSDMETGSLISVKSKQWMDLKLRRATEQETSQSNSNLMIWLRISRYESVGSAYSNPTILGRRFHRNSRPGNQSRRHWSKSNDKSDWRHPWSSSQSCCIDGSISWSCLWNTRLN